MHPYLKHLLADILEAHQTGAPEIELPKSCEEEMDEIESFVAGKEPLYTFGWYCGLEAEQFPPAEQFTEAEIRLVNKAFEKMMFTYNLSVQYPDDYPAHLTYNLLVSILNEKTAIPNGGFMGWDFCSGSPRECIFKEYCTCLKFLKARNNNSKS